MSELQDLFEQSNPIPKGITRCGDHYAQTEYMLIDPYASNYAARFKGFMEGVKHQQSIIDNLKAQLNNMEACYIGKKKQVEAVSQVLCELKESLKDFQEMDLYDKGHRVTTEYVIADLEQALRGGND